MTVIQDAHVIVGDGGEVQETSITMRGDKIMSIGAAPSGPMALLAKKIPAEGKYVTPGLIDVWSELAVRGAARGGAPSALAVDNFDGFAESEMRSALRNGVTAIYVPASGGDGNNGLGAVVRLLPGGSAEEIVISARAALGARLGTDASSGPLARVQASEAQRKAWGEAQDYREALDEYEEDLKEYEKELKKYVERWEKGEVKIEKEGGEAKPDSDGGGAEEESPRPQRRRRRPPADFAEGDEQKEPASDDAKDAEKDEDGKKSKKDKPPEKPKRPARDPDKEILLEAIEGKLRWRVETYRPADVLNALAIAEEFNLALVLEGATGAHRFADKIAAAGAKVILDTRAPNVMYEGGLQRDRDADALAALNAAGVEVHFGAGPSYGGSTATPQLIVRAAQAVAQGLDENVALRRITGDAAELLGVGEDVGRVATGMSADLVVWSDHPFAPGAYVERVFVAGKEVYRAPERNTGGVE